MSTIQWLQGTYTSIMSTELNALAIGGYNISTATFNNIQGGGQFMAYEKCDVELYIPSGFGSAPAANVGVSIWFLRDADGGGVNFEDGSASIVPARNPDLVIPVQARTGSQRITRTTMLPWGLWKMLVYNGTGVIFPGTLNVISVKPVTDSAN